MIIDKIPTGLVEFPMIYDATLSLSPRNGLKKTKKQLMLDSRIVALPSWNFYILFTTSTKIPEVFLLSSGANRQELRMGNQKPKHLTPHILCDFVLSTVRHMRKRASHSAQFTIDSWALTRTQFLISRCQFLGQFG